MSLMNLGKLALSEENDEADESAESMSLINLRKLAPTLNDKSDMAKSDLIMPVTLWEPHGSPWGPQRAPGGPK